MRYFEQRYNLSQLGTASRIMAIPAAHHRLNYIHPFPDGNGRVSRLMSHAMAHQTGIGGLERRGDYKRMMDLADMPRQGDLDGRGNLSLKALKEFVLWLLKVCLDQVQFLSGLFDLNELKQRLRTLVERSSTLKPQAAAILEEALMRGEFERGEVARITGLPERTARRVLADLTELGLLASSTPKGPVSLRFPESALEELFPRLYPQV
jgi:Fic family protein